MRIRTLLEEDSSQKYEWIRLGTSVDIYDNRYHEHNGNVDFEEPIYAFAMLDSEINSVQWSHWIQFAYTPTSTSQLVITTPSGWGHSIYTRSGTGNTFYGATPSTNNYECFYDESGEIISSTSLRPYSLDSKIQIDGIDVNCSIKWQREDNPVYIKIVQTGIYDISKYAILVEKGKTRTPIKYTFNFI